MDKGSFGVHEVELVIQSRKHLCDGSGVRDHRNGSHDFGEITSWYDSWWLVVDSTLESSWTPIHELNSSLHLNSGNRSIDVFWNNISSVHQTTSHVLSVSWVALDHHVGWLESTRGDFWDSQLFVVGFFGWNDWGIRRKHEMDSWIWHQIGLELSNVDVECSVESQRSSQRRDDLSNESVQIGVSWSLDVQVSSANVVNGFVVQHNGDIGVFK